MKTTFFIPAHAEKLYGKPEGFFSGIKVMAIGNNHYCGGYDKDNRCGVNCRNYMIPGKCGNVNPNPVRTNSFTRDVMEEYIDHKNGRGIFNDWYNTFTKFARVFSNSTRNEDDKSVWESICLYNFLDVALDENDKYACASDSEINDAKDKLLSAIIQQDPDVIVVWGEPKVFSHMLDVFRNLPGNMSWRPLENNRCGYITIDNKEIKVACIDHPSVGFSYDKARNIVRTIAPEILKN